jgi:phage terminase large subunit
MWFDKKCEAGCTALAFYGAKIDEKRGIDLGPNHDWSSHSADSHGGSAIVYEEPKEYKPLNYPGVNTA